MGSLLLTEVLKEYGQEEKCKIRDKDNVEALLQRLVKDGPTKLQVITDFDFTLTRFHKDGKRCDSCHGILDYSKDMPDDYREKAVTLFKKYYPIEIDHTMTTEEKIPLMIEWYNKSHQLLVEYGVSQNKIRMMVEHSRALLRDQASEVLSCLNDHNVPVLIFSAGVGDLLEAVLHREKAFYPNVKVVSNYMVFDDEGKCTAFKKPLIHMFNKNETALDCSNYFQELSHRHNALVLGDSLGDVNMDNGLHNPGAILKIGFLNDKIDERMESFINSFDIVVEDDQTFRLVDVIAKKIIKNQA